MAKRAFVKPVVRCVECNGDSVRGHADWCMAATEEERLLEEGAEIRPSNYEEYDDDDEYEDDDDDDEYEDDDDDVDLPYGEVHKR